MIPSTPIPPALFVILIFGSVLGIVSFIRACIIATDVNAILRGEHKREYRLISADQFAMIFDAIPEQSRYMPMELAKAHPDLEFILFFEEVLATSKVELEEARKELSRDYLRRAL